MTASNEALGYTSYPTAVLAKSSKLIPNMAMGVLVERRDYSKREWLGATLITAGIIIFNFSRMKKNSREQENEDTSYGLSLLLFSLGMDGLLASCQGMLKDDKNNKNDGSESDEKINTYRPPTALETMLFTNLYATLLFIPISIYSRQLQNGLMLIKTIASTVKGNTSTMGESIIAFFSHDLVYNIFLLNTTAAIGQIFIFLTIYYFSTLMCTTITTTRKFFTILLSIRLYKHVFTTLQWTCVGMVFGGLYLGIAEKFLKQKPSQEKKER